MRKLPMVQNAVMAACDALDGLKDGLLGESTSVPLRSVGSDVQGADILTV